MFEELTAVRRHSFHTSPCLLRKLGSIDQAIWTVSLGALKGGAYARKGGLIG